MWYEKERTGCKRNVKQGHPTHSRKPGKGFLKKWPFSQDPQREKACVRPKGKGRGKAPQGKARLSAVHE